MILCCTCTCTQAKQFPNIILSHTFTWLYTSHETCVVVTEVLRNINITFPGFDHILNSDLTLIAFWKYFIFSDHQTICHFTYTMLICSDKVVPKIYLIYTSTIIYLNILKPSMLIDHYWHIILKVKLNVNISSFKNWISYYSRVQVDTKL